jgi:threonine/homoserine/homoserine lactone efflux protein
MSEPSERLRYRFQLWWREQRDDLVDGPDEYADEYAAAAASARRKAASARWNDPKLRAVVTESTPKFIVRGIGLYFSGIIILLVLSQFIDRLIPAARSAVFVTFIVFACLWTLFMLSGAIDLVRARRRYREEHRDVI